MSGRPAPRRPAVGVVGTRYSVPRRRRGCTGVTESGKGGVGSTGCLSCADTTEGTELPMIVTENVATLAPWAW